MRISTFQFAGASAVRLENKALYKLLLRLYNEFSKHLKKGLSNERALQKAFTKYEDYIQVRMEEIKTTEIIAKSLKAKRLIDFIQKDSMMETYYKMQRVQRDIGYEEMKEAIQNLDDFEGSVSTYQL